MAKIEISATLMKSLEERDVVRTELFRLHDGFAGEYEAVRLVPRKMQVDGKVPETPNAFNIEFKSKKGKVVSIPDYILLNSRLVKADTTVTPIKEGVEGVGYYDDNQQVVDSSTLMGTIMERKENGEFDTFTLPDKIVIKGALTSKVKDAAGEHPSIPLRSYKGYTAILNYHRKEVAKNEFAFITRDEFLQYLVQNNSDDSPINIPEVKGITELELVNPDAATNMRFWNNQLLIADFRKED